MRALLCDEGLRFDPVYPDPEPLPGEALVRVSLAGICNTDLELIKGYLDFHGVLGHEFVGFVEASPDAALLGQRVVGEINAHGYYWRIVANVSTTDTITPVVKMVLR